MMNDILANLAIFGTRGSVALRTSGSYSQARLARTIIHRADLTRGEVIRRLTSGLWPFGFGRLAPDIGKAS